MTLLNRTKERNGEGQNRTGDTTIFSRVLYQLSYLAGGAKASVRDVIRSIVAVGAAVLVAASISGTTEQPPAPIETAVPAPHFGVVRSGPFSPASVRRHTRPLGPGAPPWARRLYRRSIRVLVALTDPLSGRDDRRRARRLGLRLAAGRGRRGASRSRRPGLEPEARTGGGVPRRTRPGGGARFYPDGGVAFPDDPQAGDPTGWVGRAQRATGLDPMDPGPWRDRQDYGENVTGDLLGNAIASGAPAAEIEQRFLAPRGLVRESGRDELDSVRGLGGPRSSLSRGCGPPSARTLLELTRESTPYGIPPIEGWTPGEVWTAPTAWSAWALVRLGEIRAADRLLAELHRAETPDGNSARAGQRRGRRSRPRPRRWPGPTPSRSSPCAPATAEARRSPPTSRPRRPAAASRPRRSRDRCPTGCGGSSSESR